MSARSTRSSFSNDLDENRAFYESANVLPIRTREEYETVQRNHLKHSRYIPGKHTIWILRKLYHGSQRSLLKYRLASSSIPADRDDESKQSFYFFHSFKVIFESIMSKQEPKPTNILVLLLGIPWSTALSRDALAIVGRPEAVSAFVTVDLPPPSQTGAYYPLDMHLTPKGHEDVANRLSKILRGHCYSNQRGQENTDMPCGFPVTAL
jgi:hypothetical protein